MTMWTYHGISQPFSSRSLCVWCWGGEADSAEITLEDREDPQKKLNAITSLPEGMKVAAFIGEAKDFNGADIDNGYFCYPIMYQGEKQVVFCRARRDVNSNKIYVHEV